MVIQNEGMSQGYFGNHANTNNFLGNQNNRNFSNTNAHIFEGKTGFDSKPGYTLNEEKQLFDQKFNEHLNKSVNQERRDQPQVNLSISNNHNQDKKSFDNFPSVSPAKIHYNHVNLEKIDSIEYINSRQQESD
jgi:hypothetical protein